MSFSAYIRGTRIRGSEDSRFMDESFQRIEVGYACTDTTRG